ncbi:Vesicle transport protein S20, partial [Coemansia sp. RSA 2598]
MPDLDNTPGQQVEAQLTQLDREMDTLGKDIQELAEFDGNREEHRQLSDSLRDEQRALERQLERLQLEIDGLTHDTSAAAQLNSRVEQLGKRLQGMQRTFRAALLKYRGNVRGSARREREMLLSGAATPAELRKRKVRTGNAVANAAVDLTSALRETVGMMEEEIEKSVANLGAMDESSDLLRKTKGEYGVLDGVLGQSKELIAMLEKTDKTDRWLMLVGLVVFIAVAFNIVRKRVWIPGLSTLFSLLRYVLFGWGSAKQGPPQESLTVVVATAASFTSLVAIIAEKSTSLAVSAVSEPSTSLWVDDDELSQSTVLVEPSLIDRISDAPPEEAVYVDVSQTTAALDEQPALGSLDALDALDALDSSGLSEPEPARQEEEPAQQKEDIAEPETTRPKIQLPRPDPDHRPPRTYTLP